MNAAEEMLLKKSIRKRNKDVLQIREKTNQDKNYHDRIHQVEYDIEKGIDFFEQGEQKKYDKSKIKKMDTLKQKVKQNE